MFKPKSPHCQSCGMPLTRDQSGGGTQADGRRSTTYCSHCYQNGKFTLPDITLPQMVERVKGKMREMGMPGFVAWFFVRGMGKLGRWTS